MAIASEPTIQFSIFGAIPRPEAVERAISALRHAPPEARGAVHTRPEVAAFVLDLAGYTEDLPLHTLRLLEPSFGDGAFLLEAAERLMRAWAREDGRDVSRLGSAIRAVEVHAPTYYATRTRLGARLLGFGLSASEAEALVDEWVICDDFLLAPLADRFDAVVGNPPYVRQEHVDSALVRQYRKDYATMYDRADLYVPFIERGLSLLSPGGRLSYICADRWMKNTYGGPLRRTIARGFDLLHVVGLHGADAFEGEVDAYPSVFTVARPCHGSEVRGVTRVADRPTLDTDTLHQLRAELESEASTARVRSVAGVVSGDAPWLLEADDALALLRSLESRFPTLQEAGCKVSIGVATGADRVFIAPADDLPIEPERILPLAMARDVQANGTIQPSGKALANPYGPDGRLVDLALYPRLLAYFEAHEERLRKRHVAKKTPARWYRTIDKVHPGLKEKPKLLIPDIKGKAAVAYDDGRFYPHHNLYYVTSEAWDLRALQAVLRSRLAEFQVASYAVRMRGGYLRFQAQYLRRIRVPLWKDVPETHRSQLAAAASRTREACDEAVRDLFAVSDEEWDAVRETLGDA